MSFLATLTHPGRFRALTGLTPAEFDTLLGAFTAAYQQTQTLTQAGARRQRAPGAGPTGQLPTPRRKLLFILLYVRLYPIQSLQGALFGLSQPQACAWIHRLLPVLQAALGRELVLPTRPAATSAELLARCPDAAFLLDATDRPIRRPTRADRRTDAYSGKAKRHTLKHTVLTDRRGQQIVFLGQATPGSAHDKTLLGYDAPPFPPGSTAIADQAYRGLVHPTLTVTCPPQKPRGQPRDAANEAARRAVAQQRIWVEHAIRGLKTQRMCGDIFRNHRAQLADLAAEVSAGLYNFTRRQRGRATARAAS